MFCSRRSKRIAHPKQYKNYLQEAQQFDYMQVFIGGFRDRNKLWINPVITYPQNAVNVDTLTDDMLPSQSQVFDKYFHFFAPLPKKNFVNSGFDSFFEKKTPN